MLKSVFLWIVQNVFKINTETTSKEVNNNDVYAKEYKDIDEINFNAIFSNKLANYVITDSELRFKNQNARVDLLNKMTQSMWKKMNKITAMAFGYGGLAIVPYVQRGKLYYNIVPQNRITIDSTEGELITGMTILAEVKSIKGLATERKYYRWTNYKVENGNITITQSFTDGDGIKIPTPEFWNNIQESMTISNVDRVLVGYLKSPINNRTSEDKYGVPIVYGCEDTIKEIKETLKQMRREYALKETFVGADSTMFDGKDALPKNGLFRKIDSGEDSFFEVFDPPFRDYTNRLQELYKRLEHQIGTSGGVVSDVQTSNATATEIKRSMYDTFVIVDDMRSNVEKMYEDLFYSCNVLANAYNLSAQGEYEYNFNWSYSLLEDSQQDFSQMLQGVNQGVISKVELRQWLKPDEDIKEAKKQIEEIETEEPSTEELMEGKDE